jgi:hypothetical protein
MPTLILEPIPANTKEIVKTNPPSATKEEAKVDTQTHINNIIITNETVELKPTEESTVHTTEEKPAEPHEKEPEPTPQTEPVKILPFDFEGTLVAKWQSLGK